MFFPIFWFLNILGSTKVLVGDYSQKYSPKRFVSIVSFEVEFLPLVYTLAYLLELVLTKNITRPYSPNVWLSLFITYHVVIM